VRAYVGASRRLGRTPYRIGGGLSTGTKLGGVFAWLLIVGAVEIAVVVVELTLRLLKAIAVTTWGLLDWTLIHVRQHRRAAAARLRQDGS
jgi:hypothetical protein